MKDVKLTDLARIIRSKNSGPFELTMDVFFKDGDSFARARESGTFTPALIARLYRITEDEVLGIHWFPPALALKITIVRPIASGSPGDRDVFGAQQHAPLLALSITLPD